MGVALLPAFSDVAHAAVSPALTRYPYLTDSVQTSVTVNWATDTSSTTGSVLWGPVGSCTANTTSATKTAITVISKAEYQWAATIPITPDTTYCYRVMLGSGDLLGSDPSPVFTSQVAAGSSSPFSFDVFGDWGQAYANGSNPDQTNVLSQMAGSGARFAVMTGDTAYPGGGQKEYGDMQQLGVDQSAVFGPTFWTVPGRSLPVFNVTGNHGFTNGKVQVVNWPESHAAASSGGRYQMETYPSINGSTSKSYPSMWYAFDAGGARFYILTVAWSDSNVGTGSPYQDDHDAHWMVTSAEYQWLKADLQAHPNALKFAFWHYPLYADSNSQPSDTYLQGGTGTLQGLLDQNGVAMVFNGHAHGYERNKPDGAGLVSYVLGNGGAAMGSVSGCSSYDAYALGSGGSHCGAAPAGLSLDHVYGFAKVTVNGRQVTVTPTDEMGRTFDVQTYNFAGNDFSVTASPRSVTVAPAQSASSTIATAVTSGSAQTVTLTASGLPSGATASFAPSSITAGQSSVLTIATDATTPTGTYTVTVTATGQSASHDTTVTLTVATAQANDFSMSATPSSLALEGGQSGTSTITTAVTSGSAESISLTASGQPSGVSVSFAPTSPTAGASSTMTVLVGSGTPSGSSVITVTGTSASATHSSSVTLTVTSAATPLLVQTASGTTTTTTNALSTSLNQASGAGNLLVASISVYTGLTNRVTSVTDNAGNSWARAGAFATSGHNSDGELWYAAGAAAVTSITVHTATATSMVASVQEFSGVAATNPLTATNGSSNTGTAPDSGSVTPAAAGDLVVGFLAGHGNAEALTVTTAGYTPLAQQTTRAASIVTIEAAYQVVPSTGGIGIAGSFPTAMYWAAGVASFRAA